jgi:hypothetical protein
MAQHRFVAVVGSRALPSSSAAQVAEVVRFFLSRGWGIGSGGARGADQYALESVVGAGPSACRRSVIFLPGAHSAAPGSALGAFVARGGRVVPGAGEGRAALLDRSRRLAGASSGVVAFLWGPSRGSIFSVLEAVRSGRPAAVILAGGGAALPAFPGGQWVACTLGAVAAFRWVPQAAPEARDDGAPRRTRLHRTFVVPDGEPVDALMTHISSLAAGERLWFEHAVLAGDTVIAPHEVLCDTPAFLALPRLRRRFGCTPREAAGLAELFLALEAGPNVVAHYIGEARRHSAAEIIEELVTLVARLALAEEVAATDTSEDAECVGDAVEGITLDGHLAALPLHAEPSDVAWHIIGWVQAEELACAACGATYADDDEAADIPVCPECGTAATWESRQGPEFRALVDEIDGCASLAELAALGKRIYALELPRDQAGVAWTHYTLRKAALEARITLGAPARALIREVEHAAPERLPAVGARLYRLQRSGSSIVRTEEWRRIWHVYHARRRPDAA